MKVFSETAKTNPFQMALEVSLLLLFLGLGGLFLFGFVMPTGSDKESSKKTACLSNMKQISLAMFIYADDNDGSVPPHFTFDGVPESKALMASLDPYISHPEHVFACPADGPMMRVNGMSYVNCLLLKKLIPDFLEGKRFLNLHKDIANPDSTGYMRDPTRAIGSVKDREGVVHENAIMSPHEAGFAVAFFDGHVKRMKILDRKSEL